MVGGGGAASLLAAGLLRTVSHHVQSKQEGGDGTTTTQRQAHSSHQLLEAAERNGHGKLDWDSPCHLVAFDSAPVAGPLWAPVFLSVMWGHSSPGRLRVHSPQGCPILAFPLAHSAPATQTLFLVCQQAEGLCPHLGDGYSLPARPFWILLTFRPSLTTLSKVRLCSFFPHSRYLTASVSRAFPTG